MRLTCHCERLREGKHRPEVPSRTCQRGRDLRVPPQEKERRFVGLPGEGGRGTEALRRGGERMRGLGCPERSCFGEQTISPAAYH